jgi:membrane-associated phospholipid phosphatase
MPILSIGQRGSRRLTRLSLALLAAPTAGAAQQPSGGYRSGWGDLAAIAILAGAAIVPSAAGLPHGPPDCAPCDPTTLWGIDRGAVGHHTAGAGTASDVLVLGVMGGAALAVIAGVPAAGRTGNAAVFGETIMAAYAATGWLKVTVARERPILYTADALAAADDPDNQRSLPSGHTAAAFGAAVSYVVMSGRQHLPHRARNAALLFGGAATVGALRVAAGRHFPTDVLAGAALGSLIGWLVPTVHQ